MDHHPESPDKWTFVAIDVAKQMNEVLRDIRVRISIGRNNTHTWLDFRGALQSISGFIKLGAPSGSFLSCLVLLMNLGNP